MICKWRTGHWSGQILIWPLGCFSFLSFFLFFDVLLHWYVFEWDTAAEYHTGRQNEERHLEHPSQRFGCVDTCPLQGNSKLSFFGSAVLSPFYFLKIRHTLLCVGGLSCCFTENRTGLSGRRANSLGEGRQWLFCTLK